MKRMAQSFVGFDSMERYRLVSPAGASVQFSCQDDGPPAETDGCMGMQQERCQEDGSLQVINMERER
jgi:hypothetical protein